jgi:hypothetical protein
MTAGHMRAARMSRAQITRHVATRVEDALKGEPLIETGALKISARIAATAIAVVASLTTEARRELNGKQSELISQFRGLLEGLSVDAGKTKLALAQPQIVETGKGAGLGAILTQEEGRRALGDYAVAKRLEDWAGPVVGATELNRDYGISRSSLNRWQHAGNVIGLLKGTHKHVYPTEQFVDARPVRGIADVNALISNPRTAWLWLTRGNPTLKGQRPIDLLKNDHIDDVVAAARAYFQRA